MPSKNVAKTRTPAKKAAPKTLAKKGPPPAKEKSAPLLKAVPKKVDEAKKALNKAAKSKAAADKAAAALAGPLAQKWASLHKKSEAMDAKPYNMRQSYSEKTAIVHKVLGWGYIMANRNDRLEVLFKDGIKYLISNYK